MFIVNLTYKVDLSEVEPHFDAHMTYVKKYFEKGVFVASGRKVPRTGGVILANAANLEEIDGIVKEDPFYCADIIDYEITEFLPTSAADEIDFIKTYV